MVTFEQAAAQQERERVPQPVFLEPVEDKDRRRALHTFFKQPQYAMLDTDTVTEQAGSQAAGRPVNSIRIIYKTKVLAMCVSAPKEQRIFAIGVNVKEEAGPGRGPRRVACARTAVPTICSLQGEHGHSGTQV